ncbi:MAG: SGNH/GDSL hydrolase family protein [Bacteroidia bacterium]
MNFKNSLTAKLLLATVSVAFVVLLLAVADRIYGNYFAKTTQQLIYPPCSKARHQSSEFDITVKINSLGFRDYEYPLTKKKKYRIAVIGDSFTFGWGVDLEDCWVKILEKELNISGLDIELLNLGKGGASPADYAQTAEKTIHLLKPDLVVIAALQANDLHQLIHAYDSLPKPEIEQPKRSYLSEKSTSILNRAFPNFIKRLSVQNINISQQWRRDAPALLASFQEERKQRFDALDENVKSDFQSGLLNPWLIHQAVYYPEYFIEPLDTADLEVVIGVSTMADFFAAIQQNCKANNAEMLVISVPNLAYSSKEEMTALTKYGFIIPDSLFANKFADETIKMAADENGIEFFSVSENFRQNKKEENLYYPFDGHFTKEGNRLFAASVKNIFEKKIKTN